MATKSWKTAASGTWVQGGNWDPSGAPGVMDVVLIQSHGAGESPYTVNGDSSGSKSTLTGGTVVLGDSFATLALVNGLTLTVGKSLNIGYAYNSGTITANGAGSLVATSGRFKVSGTGSNAVQFDGVETFNGGTLTDAGGLIVAGGTFAETSGLITVSRIAAFNGGSSTISGGTFNAGTLNVTGGTFTESGGTVAVSGIASFTGGTDTISGGSFSAAGLSIGSGAALALNGGTVTETHELVLPTNVSISNGGSLIMGGGTLISNDGIADNGLITGKGVITGAISGGGAIVASGGTLELTTDIVLNLSTQFTIAADASSVLQIDGTVDLGNSFGFAGASGALAYNHSGGLITSITGLNVGASADTPTNFIDIKGHAVTISGSNAHTGTGGTITLSDGSTFTLSGITGSTGGTWYVDAVSDGGSGTKIFLSDVVCFAAGTRILTTDGEKPVESLCPGASVLTPFEEGRAARPAVWIGRRRIDLTSHPRPETVAPIRIRQGAFAENVPHRDLLISPDHALFVDGKLIAARQLVNGATIVQEKGWSSVEYFHLELDQHAILLAEGLPAESYLDTGNRGFFANSGAPLVLHPDLMDEQDNPDRETASCAPFVWDEPNVRPVWQRLADRAAALGQQAPELPTTTEPGLHLLARGRRVRPIYAEGGLFIFPLPRGAAEVQLVSRAAAPADTRPWLDDRRPLGVKVSRLVLRDAEDLVEIPVDHPGLADGWWSVERYGPALRRWTNGAARLPLPPIAAPAMLEVHLAGEMVYPAAEADADAPQRRVA